MQRYQCDASFHRKIRFIEQAKWFRRDLLAAGSRTRVSCTVRAKGEKMRFVPSDLGGKLIDAGSLQCPAAPLIQPTETLRHQHHRAVGVGQSTSTEEYWIPDSKDL
jgi:hypothetical protein